MTRWMLAGAVALAMTAPTRADDEPKKENPFLPGNRPARKVEEAEKPAKADKKAEKEKEEEVNAARVAHVKLSGSLGEAPVPTEAIFGQPPENLKSKLDRIRKAAKDEKVKALYVDLGGGEDGIEVGFGRLHEIQAAIKEFRAAGKKSFAYAESLDAKQLLIGLSCDKLLIPEGGAVMVFGLRAEVGYYKTMLEKLSLKADVLKMGAYKSAVEPFLSDKMSKENREQLEALLGDQFDYEIVQGLVRARPEKRWTAEQVQGVIDQGPFTAKKARDLGVVDGLAYPDEFEAYMAKELGAPEVKVLKGYGKPKTAELDFSNPFAMFAALGGAKKKSDSKEPKIAVIYAVGAISSGKGGGNPLFGGEDGVGSDTIIEAVKQAEKDPTVKAIVLRVDSPGGSALASDMMWRELTKCKKPVVASMGDVAASGGYYIAMAAKRIYAEPGTVTGSIGVFGMKLVTGGLEEWGGIRTEVVSRGKNSGVNSTTFPWSESERAALTAYIEETYDQFLDKAFAGRQAAKSKIASRDGLKALAGGRVWTGRQALANGLVDELGTLGDAIGGAKQMAGVDPKQEMELLILPKPQNFLDKLLEGEGKMPFGSSLAGQLKLLPGGAKALEVVGPLLKMQNDPVKALMPLRIEWERGTRSTAIAP